MPIKYVGRTTDFLGKPLWEILGNLKDHGVGRLILRSVFQRYPEVSYMKILKVAPYPYSSEMDPMKKARKVATIVDRVFRGEKIGIVYMNVTTYKPDFILVPKEEEHIYLNAPLREVKKKVLPKDMEFPPLLKEYIKQKAMNSEEKIITDPKLEIQYNICRAMKYKIAEEGDVPDVTFSMGLGTPASPGLYANIRYPGDEDANEENTMSNTIEDVK